MGFCQVIIIYFHNFQIKKIKNTVLIYNNIRMWDVNEIIMKIKEFLNQKGEKKYMKHRSSDLLHNFPSKAFISIIKKEKKR